jgi:hypothetical protein
VTQTDTRAGSKAWLTVAASTCLMDARIDGSGLQGNGPPAAFTQLAGRFR